MSNSRRLVMVVAATRPVVKLPEALTALAARLLPTGESMGFYPAALICK